MRGSDHVAPVVVMIGRPVRKGRRIMRHIIACRRGPDLTGVKVVLLPEARSADKALCFGAASSFLPFKAIRNGLIPGMAGLARVQGCSGGSLFRFVLATLKVSARNSQIGRIGVPSLRRSVRCSADNDGSTVGGLNGPVAGAQPCGASFCL